MNQKQWICFEKARAGDRDAQVELFNDFFKMSPSFFQGACPSYMEFEDICQDVFLIFYDCLMSYKENLASFFTLFYKSIWNYRELWRAKIQRRQSLGLKVNRSEREGELGFDFLVRDFSKILGEDEKLEFRWKISTGKFVDYGIAQKMKCKLETYLEVRDERK